MNFDTPDETSVSMTTTAQEENPSASSSPVVENKRKTAASGWKFWPNIFAAAATTNPEGITDPDEEDEIVPEETGDFPNLFQHLPQFHVVGVAYNDSEPVVVSLYSAKFHNKWLLVISVPPLEFPYATRSIREVYKKAEKFKDLKCEIFFLSIDPWSKLKMLRNTLDPKEPSTTIGSAHPEDEVFEPKNVYFISDPRGRISGEKFFKVHCKRPEHRDPKEDLPRKFQMHSGQQHQHHGGTFAQINYPGYFLLTPDKELVQTVVIRDSGKLFEKNAQVFFGYPITEQVVDTLLENLTSLSPVYEAVKRLKETYPKATFGTFMDDMIRRVKTQEKGAKHESLFKWKGWAKAAEGVLRGGIK